MFSHTKIKNKGDQQLGSVSHRQANKVQAQSSQKTNSCLYQVFHGVLSYERTEQEIAECDNAEMERDKFRGL